MKSARESFTVNSEFTDSILNEKHKLHYNYIGQGYEFIVMQTKSTSKAKKKRSRAKKEKFYDAQDGKTQGQ